MASIRCESLTKRYGSVTAVDRLDLEIRDTEFMVLLGPSGCGKTTTLNVIAGLEEITEGDVYFDDELVNFVPPHRRNVAMVFQTYALYPQKTVAENMAFGLRLKKTPKEEIERRVAEAAEQLEIGHLLDRRPNQLSGGQRQRVALGRAIVRRPSVFLMDEPLSNLDAALRVSTRSLIKKLHQTMRTTFVYVTHDQAEAMTLADRIAVMDHGVIQQIGTSDDIYDRPRNLFVASFIGSPQMNLLEGVLRRDGDGYTFVREGFVLPLRGVDPSLLEGHSDRSTVLGLRPEDVDPRQLGSEREVLRVKVPLVSPLGSEQYVNAVVGGTELVLRLDKDVQVTAGQEMELGIDPRRVHLFDKETALSLAAE
jgi:multiple sugar transport system ATP-binding protein